MKQHVILPELTPTKNNCGYMISKLDPFSKHFIKSLDKKSIALEIGTAYGYTTIEALKTGATIYANDLDQRHLNILEQNAKAKTNQLKIIVGAMPCINFNKNFFDFIFASRVLHFLKDDDVELSVTKIFDWLKPNGKFYLVIDTPYFGLWAKKLSPLFEERKKSNTPYPSLMEPFKDYLPQDADLTVAPQFLNPFDLEQGVEICKRVGFKILKAEYINRKGELPTSFCFDGRESAGIILEKP